MEADIGLYFEIDRLFADYCSSLDEGDLQAWPEFFVENGRYIMVARENYAHGYEIPLVYLDSKGMMQDRVFSLENANIFQEHRYRHAMSGVRVTGISDNAISVTSSYIVAQTLLEGDTSIYQAGSYYDILIHENERLKFKERVVVYDTSRVQTLLATPV